MPGRGRGRCILPGDSSSDEETSASPPSHLATKRSPKSQSPETPSASSSAPAKNLGRGRGLGRGRMLGDSSDDDTSPVRPTKRSPTPPPRSSGSSRRTSQTPPPSPVSQRSTSPGTQDTPRRKSAEDDYMVTTRPDHAGVKTGTSGEPVNLVSNYFKLIEDRDWTLFEYEVSFRPDCESRRKKIRIMKEYEDVSVNVFDGLRLLTRYELNKSKKILELPSKKPGEAPEKFSLTFIPKGPVPRSAAVYQGFLSAVLHNCLRDMGLKMVGRNYYDLENRVDVNKFNISLWPGYITSLRQHENDVLLCVQQTHKVIQNKTVAKYIEEIKSNCKGNVQDSIITSVSNCTITTAYNDKVYSITGVDFTKSPLSTFSTKAGEMTFKAYYSSRYQLNIKDDKQPLLIAKPTKKGDEPPLLIPELCQIVGLTDDLRANNPLMRELGTYLHVDPAKTVEGLKKFRAELAKIEVPAKKDVTSAINKSLQEWGLRFERDPLKLKGRQLDTEVMQFGMEKSFRLDKTTCDWSRAFRDSKMPQTEDLKKWVAIVPARNAKEFEEFVKTMQKVSRPLNMMVDDPLEIYQVRTTYAKDYLHAVKEVMENHEALQLVFIVLVNDNAELYGSLKTKLTTEYGVASQCLQSKLLRDPKKSMTIGTKIIIQINAKMGGQPWRVKIPFKNTMVVGVDIYRAKGKNSIGAMVATTSDNLSSFTSSTSKLGKKEELSEKVDQDLKKCLKNYQVINKGKLPERILIYRDGVSDGQLEIIRDTELKSIRTMLENLYSGNGKAVPKLAFIVVSRRTTSRFMTDSGRISNPLPGTVVDDVINFGRRYDFYLVASTARQGTVSPCYFNIIYDQSGLDTDKLHRFTYKMCHLYYNWTGTVSVPAPIQYARKLAMQAAISYQNTPPKKALENVLHFL